MKANVVQVRAGPVAGEVRMPGSKSVTHRAFLLAAQSDRPCTVQAPLLSADTRATLSCLLALGARFHLDPDHAETMQFLPARLAPPRGVLDCANSGTTLRLLSGTVARFGQPVTLTGDDSLRARPNEALLAALRQLGARCDSAEGRAPLTIQGPLRSGAVRLPARTSSQFASSLLLTTPFLTGPSSVVLEAPVASSAYLDVTLDVAQRAGLRIDEEKVPGRSFRIPGGQGVHPDRLVVDGDWSTAAFPLAAAAITGGRVTARGLDPASRQGDKAILGLLASFGARVQSTPDGATVEGVGLQSPGTIDVAGTPDLFPVLCIVAATSRGTTTFTGGQSLRRKETDRIAAMAAGLSHMGVTVQERPDGLVVHGGKLQGATVASHDDHRIHMAFAVAGLAASGITTIDDPACAAVSYPGFHEDFERLGASFSLLQGNRAEVQA
jgi:3-phosphoshikimate 1-carboxyvinyltransferase